MFLSYEIAKGSQSLRDGASGRNKWEVLLKYRSVKCGHEMPSRCCVEPRCSGSTTSLRIFPSWGLFGSFITLMRYSRFGVVKSRSSAFGCSSSAERIVIAKRILMSRTSCFLTG